MGYVSTSLLCTVGTVLEHYTLGTYHTADRLLMLLAAASGAEGELAAGSSRWQQERKKPVFIIILFI